VENDIQQVNEAQPLVNPVAPTVAPRSRKPVLLLAAVVLGLILLGSGGYYVVSKFIMSKTLTELPIPVKESTDSSQSQIVDETSINTSINDIETDLNFLDSDLNVETELNLDSSILDID